MGIKGSEPAGRRASGRRACAAFRRPRRSPWRTRSPRRSADSLCAADRVHQEAQCAHLTQSPFFLVSANAGKKHRRFLRNVLDQRFLAFQRSCEPRALGAGWCMLDRSKVCRASLHVRIDDSVQHGAQPFEPAAFAALGSRWNRNAVARSRLGAAYADSERHLPLLWTAWPQASFSATSPFTMILT
jgi:hypothetical protein